MGKKGVPNQPHLIVTLNTLVDQFRRELKTFFKKNTIDIFTYPTQTNVKFFESEE
jgi:hypothetical protein